MPESYQTIAPQLGIGVETVFIETTIVSYLVANRSRDRILTEKILPTGAASDAIHVAVSSLNGVDLLLTWNCRHLANPHLMGSLRGFMAHNGLVLPEICTPVELAGN